MRMVVTAIVFTALAIVAASAQQTGPAKSGAKTATKKCTHEACVERGIKMGNPSSDASTWCSKNNNGC